MNRIALLVALLLALIVSPAWAVDVTVTAAEVLPTSTTIKVSGTLGATVTAGQTVYLDETTSTYKLADANGTTAVSTVVGIALNGGATSQPVVVATGGDIDPGFTVTVGAVYVLSDTAGGIAPVADLTQGWKTAIVGVGTTASNLKLLIYQSGATVP